MVMLSSLFIFTPSSPLAALALEEKIWIWLLKQQQLSECYEKSTFTPAAFFFLPLAICSKERANWSSWLMNAIM